MYASDLTSHDSAGEKARSLCVCAPSPKDTGIRLHGVNGLCMSLASCRLQDMIVLLRRFR